MGLKFIGSCYHMMPALLLVFNRFIVIIENKMIPQCFYLWQEICENAEDEKRMGVVDCESLV